MPAAPCNSSFRAPQWLALCAATAAIAIALLIYSQTSAFYWDEGFHLLAAQLISRGDRPYLDFFFPQPPLNAYWNAAWMRLFSDGWRVAHAVAAGTTGVAVMLAADFVYRNGTDPKWRLAAGATTAILFGLNALVVTYATIAQAYALCLLLIVVAFRLCVEAASRKSPLWAAGAGLAAGAAAASSLLTAPVAPVLFVWLVCCDRTGGRARKAAAFLVATIIPFLPIAWLAWPGFRPVLFDIVEYHLFYRQVGWDDALRHDLAVLTSWMESGQALLLGALAVAGVAFAGAAGAPPAWRNEARLCVAIVVVEAAWLGSIHPTFSQYFVFLVPFLAILAAEGLRGLAARFDSADRPLWPVLAVAAFAVFGLEKTLLDEQGDLNWSDVEAIAARVTDVTPPGALFLADEFVYFQTKRLPDRGLAHADFRKLSVPDSLAARMHVMSVREVEALLGDGQFATVVSCDPEFSEAVGLGTRYARMQQFKECSVFWDQNAHVRPAAQGGR